MHTCMYTCTINMYYICNVNLVTLLNIQESAAVHVVIKREHIYPAREGSAIVASI